MVPLAIFMSSKRKKAKGKNKQAARARPLLSAQQQVGLQQALQAQAQGDLAFAEAAWRALIAAKVRIAQPYCKLALICARTERQAEAHSLWKKALAIEPGSLEAGMGLAESYQQAGQVEKAKACYRRIITDHPGLVQAKYLLGNLLKAQGEFEQAAACYQQIMAQQPDYTQAHFTYSGVHEYRDRDDPHIGSMLDLYRQDDLPTEKKIQLAFALAKAFEDLEDYPQAFEYLSTGNRLKYGMFNYTIDSDAELVQNIIETFSAEALSRLHVNGEPSNRPIFILGMPRSGTSLVEKILASHSAVYGAGELDYIYALGTRLFLKESLHYQFAPLAIYPPGTFEALGKAYLEKINLLHDQASRITDKLPFNMMMIGLIRIALPNAKIIHCVRDARDTCLSIYRQNFATGNYRFAYDLRTVGQFHNLYRKLMKHWHNVFPDAIYDLGYESLTQNPENEIRRLLEACGLEWEKGCLDFYSSPGIVRTASFYQVRQPMYTRSVGLWEKYREFLQPLLEVLQEN
jgi:tetratricopeptide (TPR) repeat protein